MREAVCNPTGTSPDVAKLTEHASTLPHCEYPVSSLSDMTVPYDFTVDKNLDPVLTNANKSSCADATVAPQMLQKNTRSKLEEILEGTELIVKNTFVKAVLDFDSLKDFLQERKVKILYWHFWAG